jgi:hypothetical protein
VALNTINKSINQSSSGEFEMVQGLRDQKVKQNCNCNIGPKRTLQFSTEKYLTVTEI